MTKKKKTKSLKLRSKVPFPPTKVFKDQKKELSKTSCRKKIENV